MSPRQSDGGELRILVTGAGGFVGNRLVNQLAATLPSATLLTPAMLGAAPNDALDVTDPDSVDRWIRENQPDIVIHLAAVAAVTSAVRDPRAAWRVNLDGTLNVVLALQTHSPSTFLLQIGSAEVYGLSLNDTEIANERTLLQPSNPYAASKAAADILVRQSAANGLRAIVMRPFNHTGPGQSEAFVAPSFAGQIARIEAGLQPPVLSVGSLDDERDFLDVDDVIAAYLAVLLRRDTLSKGETFNVASGRSWRIGDLLEFLLSKSTAPIKVQSDPERLRRSPSTKVIGDASRLKESTGWRWEIPFEDTLTRLLEDKRREIVSGGH